jgi:hypothetical protein
MEYPDYSNPNEDNLSLDSQDAKKKNVLDDAKSYDRGYTKIYRSYVTDSGRIKRAKIDLYASGGVGSQIRDAETGEYYSYKVGSLDEELFFKVSMATGECSRGNKLGSNTLFYSSPEQYMAHLLVEDDDISEEIIEKWRVRKNNRSKIVAERKKPKLAVIVK